MPVGILVDVFGVFLGGIVGTLVGHKMKDDFKDNMNLVLGACSFCMGISSIVLMENMAAVIFAAIIGTAIGLAVHLEDRINRGGILMQKGISRLIQTPSRLPEAEFQAILVTCITLFCASGTGIYGAIISGILGDHSILIAKAILDLFTAVVFACNLGIVVSLVAVPQLVLLLLLFLCAGFIYPLCTTTMINDFKACGGFIILATGFRICNIKKFPVADMIPSMVLVMPLSWIWTNYVVPAVNALSNLL